MSSARSVKPGPRAEPARPVYSCIRPQLGARRGERLTVGAERNAEDGTIVLQEALAAWRWSRPRPSLSDRLNPRRATCRRQSTIRQQVSLCVLGVRSDSYPFRRSRAGCLGGSLRPTQGLCRPGGTSYRWPPSAAQAFGAVFRYRRPTANVMIVPRARRQRSCRQGRQQRAKFRQFQSTSAPLHRTRRAVADHDEWVGVRVALQGPVLRRDEGRRRRALSRSG